MAGYRLTLKRLAREHGLPLSGLTYRKLIGKIIEDNARRAHQAAGRVSALRYRRALGPAAASGEVRLPEYAVGAPTLRKAAESGAAITDALRDSLTRSLRAALRANPEDPEAAIAEMSGAVGTAMAPYARRDDPAYPPSHVQTIAVTEVRSALDLARFEYARRFVEANPSARLTKVWRHNGHLVKVPRPGHLAANGQAVPLAEPFRLTLPSGAVLQAMHPHDPTLPAEEVIGCQCSYEVRVEAGPARIGKSRDTDRVRKGGAAVGDVHQRKDGSWRKVAQPDEWERVTDEAQGMAGEPGGAQAPRGAVGGEGGRQDRKDLRGDSEAGGRGRHGRAELLELSGIPEGELTAEHPNGAFEMSGPAAARWYRARLDELRRDHPLGLQVGLKDEEDYRGMRLFSSSDGNALLAVDGRDIVSVSARKVGYEDEAQPATMPDLIRAAVASGARTANCYGTYLPSYYEQFGLRPVARLKWDQGVWDEYAASEVEAGRFKAEDAESASLFAKWNGGKPDYYFLAYGKPYGEDVPYVEGWEAGQGAQQAFLEAGGRVEKDTRGKVDIGGTITRPDGTTWKRTSTFGYSKVSDGHSAAPVDVPEPDTEEAPAKTPKELAMAGPEWKEYLESTGTTAAETIRRLELKKLIGKKYGVDPYEVVEWKAEIKAAEAKALADKTEAEERAREEAEEKASRTDLSEVPLPTLVAALERDGLKDKIDASYETREWMSSRYTLDEMPKDPSTPAGRRLLAEYTAHPESRLKLRPPEGAGKRVREVKVEPRPHWTPEFGKKIATVFNDAVPSAGLTALAGLPHVIKALGAALDRK